MLARRLSGILPAMAQDESLEVTLIRSVAALLPTRGGLVSQRPFRNPHHNFSLAGLVGGGPGLPRPGEVSLAHHGVLFLDELTLYRRDVLEALRGPLEDGPPGAKGVPCPGHPFPIPSSVERSARGASSFTLRRASPVTPSSQPSPSACVGPRHHRAAPTASEWQGMPSETIRDRR